MLAREGEKDKEKDEDLEKVKVQIIIIIIFLSSQVELKEMSFQLLLENWQGSRTGHIWVYGGLVLFNTTDHLETGWVIPWGSEIQSELKLFCGNREFPF